MKISLFIPTYNAASICLSTFLITLKTLKQADLYKVLIIDSSSTDNTVSVIKEFGFEYEIISNQDFDHGGTRNDAFLKLNASDIIIFLSQDVLIDSTEALKALVKPLLENAKLAACYGRQLPHADADIFARHLRMVNYKNNSYVRSYEDRFIWGMECVFASNAFAAYKVEALKQIGGFPKHLILGEDVYVFARLLQHGHQVMYNANAICYHSHNYSIKHNFKRYFDIGVFHRSENWILQDFGTISKQGLKFALSEWIYLLKAPWLLPKSFLSIAAKYIGYKLGCNYDKIGIRLCRKFSMNKAFWW